MFGAVETDFGRSSTQAGLIRMSAKPLPSSFKPLIGVEETTIDEKGRILIPKKKRERLGENFAMTLGTNGGLVVFTTEAWLGMMEKVNAVDSTNFGREEFSRLIFGEAEDDIRFDAQGRFVVPQRLRNVARLKDKVILIGNFDRLEIWDPEEYQVFRSDKAAYGRERREELEQAKRLMEGAAG